MALSFAPLRAAAAVVLLAASLALQAQPSARVARIGLLISGSLESPETKVSLDAVRQGLRDHAYVEGQNIAVEYRSANGNIERLPALASELVRSKVDLIVAIATPAGRAARAATATIPIVAMAMGDPVGDGLVASLSRPGGNLTGTTFLGPALVPKHLALLKEALPRGSRIAVLWHPGAFSDSTMREMREETEAAARTLRMQLRFAEMRRPEELEQAFATMIREQPDALLVFPSTMLYSQRARIVALAAKHRLPSVFNSREAAELGGFMSYGTSLPELLRRAGTYVDRIFSGAQPAELPVEQPTKFEFVINLATANALGIAVPQSLLLKADQIIR
ncbi:MAG TPA: ABC transporter substrate-binding protein [Burkholderiales bacterium]|nr:ABC transporter substrate-binding protein [Burkholderiales bacterium]